MMIRKLFLLTLLLMAAPLMSMQDTNTHNTRLMSLDMNNWQVITDNVMGGVSQGQMQQHQEDDRQCIRLTGQVSTDNNGGFVQMASDVDAQTARSLSDYQGVYLTVKGNNEEYNIHFRTTYLWFPWQSYRATFTATDDWQKIQLPFSGFQPYKTSSRFQTGKIKRMGVVAIGRDFDADLCVAEVGFYK